MVEVGRFAVDGRQRETGEGELAKVGVQVAGHHSPFGRQGAAHAHRGAERLAGGGPRVVTEFFRLANRAPLTVVVDLHADPLAAVLLPGVLQVAVLAGPGVFFTFTPSPGNAGLWRWSGVILTLAAPVSLSSVTSSALPSP